MAWCLRNRVLRNSRAGSISARVPDAEAATHLVMDPWGRAPRARDPPLQRPARGVALDLHNGRSVPDRFRTPPHHEFAISCICITILAPQGPLFGSCTTANYVHSVTSKS